MSFKEIAATLAWAATSGLAPIAFAQEAGIPAGSAPEERQALCARSIELAGVEADMEARILAASGAVRTKLETVVAPGDQSLQAYEAALDQALADAKGPVLEKLSTACVEAFTPEELRQVNAFYVSAAGRAWIEKGRTIILPALEKAVEEAEPRIREDVERGYCARMGC